MELAVVGWSQPQIAADLGITQAAVSKLLKRVETRSCVWRVAKRVSFGL
jgi:predicted transcriptional regulator